MAVSQPFFNEAKHSKVRYNFKMPHKTAQYLAFEKLSKESIERINKKYGNS